MKLLDFFSIRQKLAILLLSLLSSIAYITITSIQNTAILKQNNLLIEIAQQQQLTIEQFITAFYLSKQQAHINGNKLNVSEIKKQQFIFDKNLKTQLDGGKNSHDVVLEKNIYIAPMFDNQIRAEVEKSKALWISLQAALHNLALYPEQIDQVTIFQALHEKLTRKLTTINHLLTAQRDAKIQQDQLYLKITCFLSILLGAILTGLIAKNITQPLDNIAKASSRIRSGDLKSYPINNNHRDELGTLIYQSDELRHALSELLQKIQKYNKQIVHSSSQINDLSEQVSKVHERQEIQHEKLFSILSSLQTENSSQSERFIVQRSSNQKQQHIITDSYQSQSININILEDMQNTSLNINNNINSVRKTAEQLCYVLLNIQETANKTETLARKATIDAARSGKGAEQFTLVANQINGQALKTVNDIIQVTPLLEQLKAEVTAILAPLNHIDQQLNNSLQHALQSAQLIDVLSNEVEKERQNISKLTQYNESQISQLSQFEQELQRLLIMTQEGNKKTESNKLFAQELNKITRLLEQLPLEFKVDESNNQFRKGNEKRIFPRIHNQMAVTLQQDDKSLQGLTLDLSLSGLQLKSMQSVNFNQHTPVTFTIQLPEHPLLEQNNDAEKEESSGGTVVLLGDVMHQEEKANAFYYGVRFHTLNKKESEKLQFIFDYFNEKSEFKSE